MSFIVDSENLTISGRAGESLDVSFEFESDIKEMCIDFVVLEKMGTVPLVRKSCKNPESNLVKFNLSTEELNKLSANVDVQKNYCWGLVVHIGKNFSSIVIPKLFEQAPKFIVYPGIEVKEDE